MAFQISEQRFPNKYVKEGAVRNNGTNLCEELPVHRRTQGTFCAGKG